MRSAFAAERRVVIPRLVGGLGNQLFQVAAAVAYARRTGRSLRLPRRVAEGGRRRTYHRTVFTELTPLGLREAFRARHVQREVSFAFAPVPEHAATHLELAGYFQSARYFSRKDVLHMLKPEAAIARRAAEALARLRTRAEGRPLVAVHVRRGDYLYKSDYHPPLAPSHYERALASFVEPAFFALFSDDLAYCRALPLYRARPCACVEESDEVSLLVMAGCDHHVIANSSFSWWGAYLATRPGQRVLAPQRWFGPRGPQDVEDLFLPHWDVLPCP